MSETRAAYAIAPAAVPVLPIAGSEQVFPVHRVYCVGRNYAAHSIEMGGDPNREAPFFFQKNPDNLDTGGSFPYPSAQQRRASRDRDAGGAEVRRRRHPRRRCARLRLRLWRRPRHDAPRPAGAGEGTGAAVGNRQGFRTLGALHGDRSRGQDRPSGARRDLARRQWKAPPDGRPQPDDLEGAGDDQLSVRPVPPEGGRRPLVGNAGRGRRRYSAAT